MKSKMGRIALKVTGITLLSVFCLLAIAPVVYATDLPSSTPTIESFNAYRNVLETGDFLLIVYENTPYTGTPDRAYSQSFVWRLESVDGTTDYAFTTGYSYDNSGWGYNVVAFYFDAADVVSIIGADYWEKAYKVQLSGTPAAYDDPPTYTYTVGVSDYSALTDTDEVKTAVANRIMEIAADLDNKWGVAAAYSLIYSGEVGEVLSIYGQSFFRGAIYGVQAMAPSIFSVSISNVNVDDRTWTTTYTTELESQYTGTYFEEALTEGEGFFDVSYNMFGIVIILVLCAFTLVGNWMIAGGNLWKGTIEANGIAVVGARLAMIPFGEFALIVALCWLFISAKTWKLI